MEYSFFIGILSNFDFTVGGWVFFGAALLLVLLASSSLLYVFTKPKAIQFKIAVVMAYICIGLIFLGIVGMIIFALTYFISYAFITDFTKDY
jgi:hypothetical protein